MDEYSKQTRMRPALVESEKVRKREREKREEEREERTSQEPLESSNSPKRNSLLNRIYNKLNQKREREIVLIDCEFARDMGKETKEQRREITDRRKL